MRSFLVAACSAPAVGLLVVPSVSVGAPQLPRPQQDSVIGAGANELFTFDFSARSGPSGENPSGQVELVNQPGFPFFSGPVTCLSVQGNVALMNVQTSVFGLLLLRVTDNTLVGLADRVEADFAKPRRRSAQRHPPHSCSIRSSTSATLSSPTPSRSPRRRTSARTAAGATSATGSRTRASASRSRSEARSPSCQRPAQRTACRA